MPPIKNIASKVEFSVLAALITIAGGLYGFVEMAEVARDTEPHGFDRAILLAFRAPANPADPIGPLWAEEAVRDLTALGSASVLIFLTAATIFYLLLTGRRAAALFVLVAVAGGQLLSSLLKLGVDRPRPDLVPHLAEVYTLSFPSGHAMLSAVTYLTLGALAARVAPNRATGIYLLSLAILATFLVGASRVYLGVHWPSDVLAGWCAGAAWAMLCWLVAQWVLSRRRALMDLSEEQKLGD
ncbi:phosphatase PAP2 family protein [Mesorhizobium sp. LHD-90]|uniref:phosphatase PAP2 family protein n=1 Tax=Mesorhizobium sp. LHD-90 TaxID=3071414 RepID=UPI0027DFAEC6|nr:phosphatase PAP2 family protein [Mesorhizobium sp. LHD-90]MDQ6436232.1 phosphatase PAP2 family protein [Mesorhizobium sp. LHD-90]